MKIETVVYHIEQETMRTYKNIIFILLLFDLIFSGCKTGFYYVKLYQDSQHLIKNFSHFTDIHYGDHSLQTLDIYLPKNSPVKAPVLVFIHGGGWENGDKANQAALLRPYLKRGVIGVMINYRLVPEFTYPAQLEDCFMALKWVYENIENYNGGSDSIHVVGHSAGAHLAALIGLRDDLFKRFILPPDCIKSCTLLSGIYDLRWPFKGRISHIINAFIKDRRFIQDASPHYLLKNKIPKVARKFLVVTGTKDIKGLSEQALIFFRRLKDRGYESRFILLSGQDHTGVLLSMSKERSEVFSGIISLIKEQGYVL